MADLLYKYSDLTQAQIGQFLGDIDDMSVSQLRRRSKEKMKHDAAVRKRYSEVEKRIKNMM